MKSEQSGTRNFFKKYFIAAAFLLVSSPIFAQSIKVAVAANLQTVIKVLDDDFTAKTGIKVDPIVGPSGNLSNQIRNGAPFDVFLSADMAFPQALFKEGFATRNAEVYARGSLIIASSQNIGFENWERLLLSARVKKLAIANPAIAPYGKAAEEALTKKGLLNEVKPKVVYGESIAQVNTYITTGTVEAGFTTQSLAKDAEGKTKLYWQAIDPKLYSPIEQGMVVIKTSANLAAAEKFFQYMQSQAAKNILKQYGYLVQ